MHVLTNINYVSNPYMGSKNFASNSPDKNHTAVEIKHNFYDKNNNPESTFRALSSTIIISSTNFRFGSVK